MHYVNQTITNYQITFDLSIWEKEKLVWLNNFIIPNEYRLKGLGTSIMSDFSKWLDSNEYDSKLLVSSCYGTSEYKLIDFYKKFDYKIYHEKNHKGIYMERKHG